MLFLLKSSTVFVRIKNNELYFSISLFSISFLFIFISFYLGLEFNMMPGLQLSQTHHMMYHTSHKSHNTATITKSQ